MKTLAALMQNRILTLVGLVLFVLSLYFRLYQVSHIPGVNGDEAILAVQAHDVVQGKPVVLRFPTGRLLSPVYAGILMLVEKLFPFNFWSLRVPAMFFGILLVVLSYFLIGRVLGYVTGAVFFLLLAFSPVNIAYSRVGIEQCLMCLVGLLVVYYALRGIWWGIFLSFGLALIVHPINVFLFPLVFLLSVYHVYFHPDWTVKRKKWTLFGVFSALYLGVCFVVLTLPKNYQGLLDSAQFIHRMTDQKGMLFFVTYFTRLFTGTSAYEQYSNPIPTGWVLFTDTVFILGFLTLLYFGMSSLWKNRKFKEMAMVAGSLLLVLIYYLITGTHAIEPGVVRYALVFLVPIFLSISILLSSLKPVRIHPRGLLLGVLVWGAFSLSQFYLFYFQSFYMKNSSAHFSYKTGPNEPKALALNFMLQDAFKSTGEVGKFSVVADDWYSFWPIRYLALSHEGVQVFRLSDEIKKAEQMKDFLKQGGYAVGFKGGPFEEVLPKLFQPGYLERFEVEGYSNEKILTIWRLKNGRS